MLRELLSLNHMLFSVPFFIPSVASDNRPHMEILTSVIVARLVPHDFEIG